jgi:hypothetical protein
MIYPGWCPVVPGGYYPFVPDENGTYMPPQTGGTLGHKLCYAHKVFFPGWAFHFFHCFMCIYFSLR